MPLDVNSAPPGTTPRETRLADYRPPAFLVDNVELSFDLDAAATRVRSRMTVRRNAASMDAGAPLPLDGEALTLLRVALNGEELGANRYLVEDGRLVIPDMPDASMLEIETRIAPKDNTELSGLYTSGGNFFTQCEAEGFRRITYFPDRPDVMARYTTTITADARPCPVLLSNGNPGAVERCRRWPALGHLGRSAPEALLPVRARRRRSGRGARTSSPPAPAARGARHLGAPRRRGPLRAMRCAR